MFAHVKLNLDFDQVLSAEYWQHSESSINHRIHRPAYEQYGQFPKSYNINNTLIHQLWWNRSQLDFDYIGQQLGMEVVSISTICQPPGNMVPLHIDSFFQINQQYPNRKECKVRANIFLEDYKMGHFLQFNHNGTWITQSNWTQGQGLLWDNTVLHLSANAGFENKYTMQISGFYLNN